MSQVTSPIILDSTGQDIVTQLAAISAAIASGNIITANTQTNLNGVLSGNGTTVTVKSVDAAPTANSQNLITSGGIYSAITAVPPWYEGVDLTQAFADEISNYSDPWAWIKARIQASDFTGIHVNDYIPFTTTNNITLKACVGGINTYKGYGDTAVGNHIDFICRELWPTRHSVNPINFNNGTKFGDNPATEYPWLASDLYLWLNSRSGTVASATTVGGGTGTEVDYTSGGVYYYLPTNLKDVIVKKRAYLPKRYSASGLLSDDNAGGWADIGKLWLPSEFEVYGGPVWGGKNGYTLCGNCVQYPIFAHNMNRVKNRSGSRDYWWVLSVCSGKTTHWCYVNISGDADRANASNTNIAAPVCFRIA